MHKEAGGAVLMLTLTARYHRGQRLDQWLPAFLSAEKLFRQRREWRRLVRGERSSAHRPGWPPSVIGTVRAMEVTWGDNGWHPHAHILVFFTPGIPLDVAKDALEGMRACWRISLEARGLWCSRVGFDVRNGDSVAEYVTKFGRAPKEPERSWGAPQEMTLAAVKKGRQGGLTPWQLLGIAAGDPVDSAAVTDKRAGDLFREYAAVFKGRRQLVYSPGLRAALGLNAEVSDADLAADRKDEGGQVLATIDGRTWSLIVSRGLRAWLLEIALNGAEALAVELDGLRAEVGLGAHASGRI